MTAAELASQIRERTVDKTAFEKRVRNEAETLKSELKSGTFDNPQAIVGLEYELYAVDRETNALMRVPRHTLELIGFESELGLHNAEMHTSPQPLNQYGLACQETEIQSRIAAAQEQCHTEDIHLVSDGFWTISPTGESALDYLDDSVEADGLQVAVNMSKSVRYHCMTNNDDTPLQNHIETPTVSVEGETVNLESLTTSIQPHYQVPRAVNLPTYYRYALRIAGPVLALGVNSPFFPPELYDDSAETVLDEGWMENRIPTFAGVLNPAGEHPEKVRFPDDIGTVTEAVDDVVADDPIAPMSVPDGNRFDDQWRHFTHKRGAYWRWIRPVFEGASRSAANARVEFRPLPAQPTIRDSIAFLALFAGLMDGLYARDHPVSRLDWEQAKENFHAAKRDGLDAEFEWITADGQRTTDSDALYEELFDIARDGLVSRGFSRVTADEYLRPLEARVEHHATPARWKQRQVRKRVVAGDSLDDAIREMQSVYIQRQVETMVTDSFLDWLEDSPRVRHT